MDDPNKSAKKIEQLKEVPTSEIDTIRYKCFTGIGIYYGILNQRDSSYKYLYKALELTKENTKHWSATMRKIAILKRMEGKYNEALSILNEALVSPQIENDYYGIATIYSEMASNYNSMSNKIGATKYLMKAIESLEKMENPDKLQLTIQKHNLANAYLQNDNYDFAEKLFKETLQSFRELKSRHYIALNLLNLGDCLLNNKKFDEASDIIKEALKELKAIGNSELVAMAYINLAALNKNTNKSNKEIEQAFENAIKEASKAASPRTIEILNHYLNHLIENKNYSKVVVLGNENKSHLKSANMQALHTYYGNLGKAYKALGDMYNAAENLEKYGTLGDTIYQSENQVLASQTLENYEKIIQKKENENLVQAYQILKQETKIKFYIFLSIAAVLISVILYYRNKMLHIKHTNEVLSLKVQMEDAEIKNMQQELRNERMLLKMKEDIIEVQKKELLQLSKQGSVISEKIDKILEEPENTKHIESSSIIKSAINNQFWDQFKHRFLGLFPNFYQQVETHFGKIFTEEDLQHLALHKLELSVSDIAYSLTISAVQAEKHKKNLMLKFKCETEVEFANKLQSFE
ncbi:MAG: tetratricopeptide repeat protein [Bacteroidia bacterium]|nr:tetratricopeptide repeat protein [Bacteroidia bacterium]